MLKLIKAMQIYKIAKKKISTGKKLTGLTKEKGSFVFTINAE